MHAVPRYLVDELRKLLSGFLIITPLTPALIRQEEGSTGQGNEGPTLRSCCGVSLFIYICDPAELWCAVTIA